MHGIQCHTVFEVWDGSTRTDGAAAGGGAALHTVLVELRLGWAGAGAGLGCAGLGRAGLLGWAGLLLCCGGLG